MSRDDSDELASAARGHTEPETLFRPLSEAGESPTETDIAELPSRDASKAPRVNPYVTDSPSAGPRYELRSVLGRGGMGEVQLCRDARIGRDVAVKFVLPRVANTPDGRARFLREARVQGQLEHPVIVPVHDLELLEDGTAFFTMKRVRGMTLADVVKLVQAGDPEARQRFTRRRLLSLLSTVCLGVDFAHSRGVVHRDLKPSNVMIGDFGEVYLLDWGLAKILDVDDTSLASPDEEVTDGGVETQAGAVMGTPGYMAPEQLDGSLGPLDARSDVYALGAILFEVLTGRPVIESKKRIAILRETLEGVDARAASRAPDADIPPELEDICVTALQLDPKRRFSSARAMHEALEEYLEGAQDLERRRRLSREHADVAERALEAALAGGDRYEEHRGQAMQELARAMALDPEDETARAMMLRLLTEPPRTPPPEVIESLEEHDNATIRMGARLNAPLVLAWLPFVPLGMWSGVRDWPLVALVLLPIAVAGLISLVVAKQPRPSSAVQILCSALTFVSYVGSTRLFGPFVTFPALVSIYCVVLHSHPRARDRRSVLALSIVALIAPFALEALGVLPRSYTFEGGAMVVHSQLLDLREGPVTLFVLLSSLALTVLPSLYMARMRRTLSEAERRVQVSAWHLSRLVPRSGDPRPLAGGAMASPETAPADTAPGDTAPGDTAPADTAPADTAPPNTTRTP